LFFSQALTILLSALGLRLAGLQLSLAPASAAIAESPKRMQFAMQDLIIGTAIVAAMLWLYPNLFIPSTIDDLLYAAKYGGGTFWFGEARSRLLWMTASGAASGAIAVLAVWFLLRTGSVWFRTLAFCVAAWAMARIAILSLLDFDIYARHRAMAYVETDRGALYIAWLGLQAAIVSVTLLAARWEGPRLAHRLVAVPKSEGAASRPTRTGLRPMLARSAFALFVLCAVFFDKMVSHWAGDQEVRRTVATINSKAGSGISAFCFWNAGRWPPIEPPAVGARLTGPIDASALKRLCEMDGIEGLWLDGEFGEPCWKTILQLSNPKLLRVDAQGVSGRFTDKDLTRLAALRDLQQVQIFSPDISDAGIKQLARLPNLVDSGVFLECPKVTQGARLYLKRILQQRDER
jgi:hypothetical protein